ncbi:hypothetical protein CSKR_200459 [Clonorchis sinensis]|uniref:Uncharacterized protein n=1 Tax=Clonorchis sinensis TaxID=79923 RepID=A0A8T1MEK6_CLOSI|nr:hypothetical protein CSKR_200459 [Clonorchis sinensis]
MLRNLVVLLFFLICAANAQTNSRSSGSLSGVIENLRSISQTLKTLREVVNTGAQYYGIVKKMYCNEEPGVTSPKTVLQKIARSLTYQQGRPSSSPPPQQQQQPPPSSYYSPAPRVDEYGRRAPERR